MLPKANREAYAAARRRYLPREARDGPRYQPRPARAKGVPEGLGDPLPWPGRRPWMGARPPRQSSQAPSACLSFGEVQEHQEQCQEEDEDPDNDLDDIDVGATRWDVGLRHGRAGLQKLLPRGSAGSFVQGRPIDSHTSRIASFFHLAEEMSLIFLCMLPTVG